MYVLLFVFISFQIFGIFMMKQYEQPTFEGDTLIGSMNESQFIQYLFAQTPSWVMLYIAVFTVYFYMSEYNAGFYKNYISNNRARIHSVISKVLILGLFTFLMFVALIVSNFIGRTLFYGQIMIDDYAYLVNLLIGHYLLHWSFSIIVLCATIMIKNSIASLVVGVILSLNIVGMLLSTLEGLISDTKISSYLLINTIVTIKDFGNIYDVIHVLSVAVFFFLLFTTLAIQYKRKEDLR